MKTFLIALLSLLVATALRATPTPPLYVTSELVVYYNEGSFEQYLNSAGVYSEFEKNIDGYNLVENTETPALVYHMHMRTRGPDSNKWSWRWSGPLSWPCADGDLADEWLWAIKRDGNWIPSHHKTTYTRNGVTTTHECDAPIDSPWVNFALAVDSDNYRQAGQSDTHPSYYRWRDVYVRFSFFPTWPKQYIISARGMNMGVNTGSTDPHFFAHFPQYLTRGTFYWFIELPEHSGTAGVRYREYYPDFDIMYWAPW